MLLNVVSNRFVRVALSYIGRVVTVTIGLIALLVITVIVFRLDALLSPLTGLIPSDSGRELSPKQVVPFLAFAIGLALQLRVLPPPQRRARRRRVLIESLVATVLFVVLLISYKSFVCYENSWSRAYVISWARSDNCEFALNRVENDDAVESNSAENRKKERLCEDLCGCKCIEVLLSFQALRLEPKEPQEMVYLCWDKGRVQLVEVSLALLYFFFAVSFGSVTGLFLRSEPVPMIFVSYRSKNSSLVKGPIAKALGHRYRIFIDKEGIDAGEDWAQKIRVMAKKSDVFVVIIGPGWFSEFKARAKRKEQDWVLYELETAIRRKVEPVSLVFGGAKPPQQMNFEGRLENLKQLAESQAVVLDEDVIDIKEDFRIVKKEDFQEAMADLIVAIDRAADQQIA